MLRYSMQRGTIIVKVSLQLRAIIGIMMKTAKLPCGKERGRETVLFSLCHSEECNDEESRLYLGGFFVALRMTVWG